MNSKLVTRKTSGQQKLIQEQFKPELPNQKFQRCLRHNECICLPLATSYVIACNLVSGWTGCWRGSRKACLFVKIWQFPSSLACPLYTVLNTTTAPVSRRCLPSLSDVCRACHCLTAAMLNVHSAIKESLLLLAVTYEVGALRWVSYM